MARRFRLIKCGSKVVRCASVGRYYALMSRQQAIREREKGKGWGVTLLCCAFRALPFQTRHILPPAHSPRPLWNIGSVIAVHALKAAGEVWAG